MSATLRTFIAIPVTTTPKLSRIDSKLREIGGPVRSVDLTQMHLTLSFLGETRHQQLTEIGEAIDAVAQRHQAFEVEIAGVDAFPNRDRPRVFWAGLSPTEDVVAIAEDLRNSLEELGFHREQRAFTPHLTLAYIRGKPPSEVTELMDENRKTSFGTASIEKIVLYQSRSTNKGPQYIPLSLHELRLG